MRITIEADSAEELPPALCALGIQFDVQYPALEERSWNHPEKVEMVTVAATLRDQGESPVQG